VERAWTEKFLRGVVFVIPSLVTLFSYCSESASKVSDSIVSAVPRTSVFQVAQKSQGDSSLIGSADKSVKKH
jgi:hypothetical protein